MLLAATQAQSQRPCGAVCLSSFRDGREDTTAPSTRRNRRAPTHGSFKFATSGRAQLGLRHGPGLWTPGLGQNGHSSGPGPGALGPRWGQAHVDLGLVDSLRAQRGARAVCAWRASSRCARGFGAVTRGLVLAGRVLAFAGALGAGRHVKARRPSSPLRACLRRLAVRWTARDSGPRAALGQQ